MTIRIFNKKDKDTPIVDLELEEYDDGVYLNIVDDYGDCMATILSISHDGCKLFKSLDESFGIALDKEGRIKCVKE